MSIRETVAILATPRLRLRPFVETDAAALRQFQMDAETMSTYGGGIALTEEQADRVLKYHIECRAYPYWAWAVTRADDDICFGQMTAGWIEREGEKWIEMGWILRKEMWGRGYGTEALGAMLRHGVTEIQWPRVMATARPDNYRSRRIMEKVGMQFLRQEPSTHGGMRDVFVLPEEWGRRQDVGVR